MNNINKEGKKTIHEDKNRNINTDVDETQGDDISIYINGNNKDMEREEREDIKRDIYTRETLKDEGKDGTKEMSTEENNK